MIEESLPPNPKALLRTWVRGFRGERREERGEWCHRLGQHLENMIEESLPPNPKALLRTWVRGVRGEVLEERGERREEG
jgi:hypothetical protein